MADTPSASNSTPSKKPFSSSSSDTNHTTMSLARMRKGPIGDSGLIRYNGRVYEESQEELRFPESIRTFNKMSFDSSISAARSVFGMFIRKTNIMAIPKEGQEKNKKAIKNAEFINWQLDNFEEHSWRQVVTDIMTYDLYGFSIMEMLFEQMKEGEFNGLFRVKDLSPRAQASLNKWIWSDDGRKLLGFEQNIRNINGRHIINGGTIGGVSTVKIPIKKCLLFSYNATKDNPQGNSPLKGCYVTWKFKCLLEDYEATGVAKDMAGMPVFGIDKDVLIKARTDPSSSEAVLVNYLETAGANMHAGEQNFLVNPIAYDERGKPLFSFELTGVQGASKSFDLDQIIKRRQNEILMAYFADVLKLGQDGVGSYALADSKTNLLGHAVEDHLDFILETFQRQFIKTIADLNGWSAKDTPVLIAEDIEDRDLDSLGKYIQRVISVGAMSADQDLDAALRKAGNLPSADYTKPISGAENNSRAGDGMKTAGEGTSNNVNGKDNSVSNKENASSHREYTELFSIMEVEDDNVVIQTPTGRVLNMTFEEMKEFFN